MSTRHSVRLVVACLLLALWVAPARAGERDYWRHSRGHFENTSGNKWTEKIDNDTYHFVEVERNEKYVELYDKGRDCRVHLTDHECWVKDPGVKWLKYYDGHWGK